MPAGAGIRVPVPNLSSARYTALGMNLLKFAGIFLGIVLLLVLGTVGYTYWSEGPYTAASDAEAAMERLKDVDLAAAGLRFSKLKDLLGEPEFVGPRGNLQGAAWVRWYRGAVSGYVGGEDEMVSLTLRDASRTGEQPFWGKSVFRGSLHGLRIGGPLPTPEERKALEGLSAASIQVAFKDEAGRLAAISAHNMKVYIVPLPR
jgi:hypothetical protein